MSRYQSGAVNGTMPRALCRFESRTQTIRRLLARHAPADRARSMSSRFGHEHHFVHDSFVFLIARRSGSKSRRQQDTISRHHERRPNMVLHKYQHRPSRFGAAVSSRYVGSGLEGQWKRGEDGVGHLSALTIVRDSMEFGLVPRLLSSMYGQGRAECTVEHGPIRTCLSMLNISWSYSAPLRHATRRVCGGYHVFRLTDLLQSS